MIFGDKVVVSIKYGSCDLLDWKEDLRVGGVRVDKFVLDLHGPGAPSSGLSVFKKYPHDGPIG